QTLKAMVRIKGAGYYAVARGKHVGIYHSWPDCEKQVRGYPNAKFKKFQTEHEANNYIEIHRIRDGGYAYSMNPSSSLSSPYPRSSQQAPPPPSAPPQDPHDITSGFDNMAATALMSLFGRPSTSASSSPTLYVGGGAAAPLPFAVQQQQQRAVSTAAPSNGVPTTPNQKKKRPRPKVEDFAEEYDTCKKVKLWSSTSFTDAPVVYTDGACSKNGRSNAKAGWGVWWGDGHADNDCGAVSGEQTNNRAEMLAVIKAIQTARNRGMLKLIVRTDSQLLINSMDKWIVKWKNNGWKNANGKDVKNQDLLQILDMQLEVFPVHFEHVPGHAGVHGNEMADQLARHAAAEAIHNESRQRAVEMSSWIL
ncbi:hypothetical protein PENTCL1PPCAC_5633, partial [Pristionchus entomophagus]